MADLTAITRPNGTPYRPQKLTAYAVTDEYEVIAGVVVFGTHDPGRAQALADELVARDVDQGYTAADPVTVWWRDGFECGRRAWITDEEHGRGGVWFREIVERTPADLAVGRKDATPEDSDER